MKRKEFNINYEKHFTVNSTSLEFYYRDFVRYKLGKRQFTYINALFGIKLAEYLCFVWQMKITEYKCDRDKFIPLSINKIAEHFDTNKSTVKFHLDALINLGIVKKGGATSFYGAKKYKFDISRYQELIHTADLEYDKILEQQRVNEKLQSKRVEEISETNFDEDEENFLEKEETSEEFICSQTTKLNEIPEMEIEQECNSISENSLMTEIKSNSLTDEQLINKAFPYFKEYPEDVKKLLSIRREKRNDGTIDPKISWNCNVNNCPECGALFPVGRITELNKVGKNICPHCGSKLKNQLILGQGFKLIKIEEIEPIRTYATN